MTDADSQPVTTRGSVAQGMSVVLVTATGLRVEVGAILRYDRNDPFAVRVAFRTSLSAEVEWTFARQLLTEGVSRPTGEGDVRVRPGADGRIVCLQLCSPSGSAAFELPRAGVVEFLARSAALVPTGCESDAVDLDAALEQLLGTGLAP